MGNPPFLLLFRGQLLQLVSDFGGLLVVLLLHRFVQRQFQLLAFRQRAGAVDLTDPVLQVLYLGIMVGVGPSDFGKESSEVGDATLDFANGFGVALGREFFARAGAHLHEEQLGTELLQRPGKFFGLGKAGHEIKDREVAVRVPDDGLIVFQFEEADVTVMKLQRLQLELGAILRLQNKTLLAALRFDVLFQARLLILEERRVAHGAFAVGPALRVHLEQSQIDAELNFFLAIAPLEAADDNLAGLIVPAFEERCDVEIHRCKYGRRVLQVNAVPEKVRPIVRARQFSLLASRGLSHSAPMRLLPQELVLQHVRAALAEDIGSGDVTTLATVPADATARAALVAREEMVVCGTAFAEAAFQEISSFIQVETLIVDGATALPGAALMHIAGPARALLTAERVALNFMQRLSGVATLTARFVQAVEGTSAVILDTRKTTPGWRELEKYAVACGGGRNHRFGLWDMVLIKDNHLAALRATPPNAIAAAVQRARENFPALQVEVEADTLAQVRQAVDAGADIVLLDNMSLEVLRTAVQLVGGRAKTEASGGVNLQTVRGIAGTGVDYISVGALTHSACAMDLGLDFF